MVSVKQKPDCSDYRTDWEVVIWTSWKVLIEKHGNGIVDRRGQRIKRKFYFLCFFGMGKLGSEAEGSSKVKEVKVQRSDI